MNFSFKLQAFLWKALVPTAGTALSAMLTVIPTRHPFSKLTPAPAVGTA